MDTVTQIYRKFEKCKDIQITKLPKSIKYHAYW